MPIRSDTTRKDAPVSSMPVATHTYCLIRPRFAAFLPLLQAGYDAFAVAFVAVAEVRLVNPYAVVGNRVE